MCSALESTCVQAQEGMFLPPCKLGARGINDGAGCITRHNTIKSKEQDFLAHAHVSTEELLPFENPSFHSLGFFLCGFLRVFHLLLKSVH